MTRKKRAAIGAAVLFACLLLLACFRGCFSGASLKKAGMPPASVAWKPMPGPVIVTQPKPQTVRAPATTRFCVAVKEPAFYQWQISFDAGTTFLDIPGAASATYVTPPAGDTDTMRLFRVIVSDRSGGSTVSNAAPLTVTSSRLGGVPVSITFSHGVMRAVVLPNLLRYHQAFQGASLIQAIASDGTVTTLTGNDVPAHVDGVGNDASFNFAGAAVADDSGNVFVTDTGNRVIRRITPAGVVSTFAGSGRPGTADGPGTTASFDTPRKLVFDTGGNLYVSDGNRIRKITPAGLVTTLAGGTSGHADGIGASAQFVGPDGLALDPAGGALYVADTGSNAIRKVMPANGATTTLTGRWSSGPVSEFYDPNGLARSASGSLVVTDWPGGAIRQVSPAGGVSIFAGAGIPGYADGSATAARFAGPNGIAVDGTGDVWVSERINRDIRRVSAGVVSTVVRSE